MIDLTAIFTVLLAAAVRGVEGELSDLLSKPVDDFKDTGRMFYQNGTFAPYAFWSALQAVVVYLAFLVPFGFLFTYGLEQNRGRINFYPFEGIFNLFSGFRNRFHYRGNARWLSEDY